MFDWIKRRVNSPVEQKSLSEPEAWLQELFGASPVNSGIAATPRNAMTCAPVRCAVQAISEAIGQLPIHVYRRDETGAKERAPDHPAHSLLHDQANDWTPASGFREALTRDALLFKNGGFGFINRVEGKPIELLRLDPESVTVKVHPITGEPIYAVADAGKSPRQIARDNILHIPSPSLTGCGLVHDAREAVGLALVMEQYAARLFGRGARPSGMLSFKSNMTPESLAKAKAAWQSAHGGSNSGGTAVMPGDAEWQALTLNSVDAQFLEMRAFAVAEIARVFRVPPVFLMDYGRATWGNAEEMGRQFLTYTLMPWVKRWEGEIRLKLFTLDERKEYFAEFLTDDLLRADFDSRMEGYSKAIAARILNPNEARAAENRPPYEGGDKFENPNTATGAP